MLVLSTGFVDDKIYKVSSVGVNTTTGSTVRLNNLDGTALTGLTNFTGISSHVLVTPRPFIHPTNFWFLMLGAGNTKYTTIKPTGMFPYKYTDAQGNSEGYIDTTLNSANSSTLKTQIDAVNDYYDKWVNQNVDINILVYEYRVPRSRFSGDRLDDATDDLLYSDAVADKRAGSVVLDADTQEKF